MTFASEEDAKVSEFVKLGLLDIQIWMPDRVNSCAFCCFCIFCWHQGALSCEHFLGNRMLEVKVATPKVL